MIFVRDAEDLSRAAKEARACGRIGLDTEFLREKTYRARLCLVQVAVPDEVYLIDPLGGLDLAEVADLMADPSIELVVHAGRQDLELFYELYGAVPTNVFDVQLAAAFAGLGASLPYGKLVETLFSTRLVKGESYSDWCRRPLTDAQLTYAADDVRYLLRAAEALYERLERLGRIGWVREEARGFEAEETYRADVTEAWRRVSGRGTLSGRQLAVLRALAAWREETARKRDIPRGWVIKDPTLVEIARRAPTNAHGLGAIRGLGGGEVERSGVQILEAVRRGKDALPIELRTPPKAIQMRARLLSGVADTVVRARCESAGVATELVATRAELEALLAEVAAGRLDESRHRLMQGWRRDVAGEAVLALAQGRVAVKALDQPPYIEEVWVNP